MNPEKWHLIPTFEKYEASTLGRIRNVTTQHVLSPSKAPNGYLCVILMRDSKRVSNAVHRLIALTFLGPPNGKQVNHKSGIKTENHFENLEYCTPLENKEHARRMGLTPFGNRNGSVTHPERRPRGDNSPSRLHPERLARGENHGNATLSDTDVAAIRARLSSGERGASLAREFKVGKSTISRIANNQDRFRLPHVDESAAVR